MLFLETCPQVLRRASNFQDLDLKMCQLAPCTVDARRCQISFLGPTSSLMSNILVADRVHCN